MKIFYSMPYGFERIINSKVLSARMTFSGWSGWGHLVECVERELIKAGHEIYHTPEEADIELVVGQPPHCLKPEMNPAVMLSMYETTKLPSYWADVFNRFDAIVNPSVWGKRCFEKCGVTVPIHVIPLGVDSERFTYQDKEVRNHWIYLSQGVQLSDRKGLTLAAQIFLDDRMPVDTHLVLKTIPTHKIDIEVRTQLHPQIEWIQQRLSWEDLEMVYHDAHVSVNPSSGEGFGLIPLEHMLCGMCTIFPDYSGLAMMADSRYNLPVRWTERITPHYKQGKDCRVDEDHLYKQMIWAYENQTQALEMGRLASEWVSKTFSCELMIDRLTSVLEDHVKKVPKYMAPFKRDDNIDDWIRGEDLWGEEIHELLRQDNET